MLFRWSKNAEIGLKYLPEWTPDNAISESKVNEVEKHLDLEFPSVLRDFYLSWGNHLELTSTTHLIFEPEKCKIQGSYLLIAVENQYVFYWGIRLEDIRENNPPVFYAYKEGEPFEWHMIHKSVSEFLDYLLFGHAFHHKSNLYRSGFGLTDSEDKQSTFLKSNFELIQLDAPPWGLRMESKVRPWNIYFNRETLLTFNPGISFKSLDSKMINDLENNFKIKWQYLS